jgi:hypothetical protein
VVQSDWALPLIKAALRRVCHEPRGAEVGEQRRQRARARPGGHQRVVAVDVPVHDAPAREVHEGRRDPAQHLE